jgi:molybdenum-dependent DNA-binding transcriptional regulator ModE
MRAFVAVAKTGSFSAAAQKLDLVPSVVTKRVTQLDRIVGKTLFHRSSRKVVLSPDGEHHLERIIAAIAAHDQRTAALHRDPGHTRYVMLAKVANKDTQTVVSALIKQAKTRPNELYKSLTWDPRQRACGSSSIYVSDQHRCLLLRPAKSVAARIQ